MFNFVKNIATGGDFVGGWVGDVLKNQKLSPPVKAPSNSTDFIGGWVGDMIKKPQQTPTIPKPHIPTPKTIPTPTTPTSDIGNPAMTGDPGTTIQFFQHPSGLSLDERYRQALEEAAKNPKEKSEFVGGVVGDALDKMDEKMIKIFEKQMELQREAMRRWVIDLFKTTGGFLLDVASVGAMAAFVYYSYMVMMGSLESKEKHTQRLFISGMSIFLFRILKALLMRC